MFCKEDITMTTNAVVRARIDHAVKDEATHVLAAMGLTVSDAFRLLLVRIAKDKALPFSPLVPSKETIAAMREAREGKLTTVKKNENLLDSLNADD
jgi:DNA-damage-inducible protein J